MFAVRHSLHRKPTEAKGFYAIYFGLTLLAAGLVLTPGCRWTADQRGAITRGVLLQAPRLFLCCCATTRPYWGPWTNGRATNIFTARGGGAGDALRHPDGGGAVSRHRRVRDRRDPDRRLVIAV
ncbi:hypothetical protein [Arthrobacter methylotrophus]|uniref:hypothetical protein n=1 Tax=Arthrobacter methylotrophus TaxID=121291 RepID=UPI0031EFE4C3